MVTARGMVRPVAVSERVGAHTENQDSSVGRSMAIARAKRVASSAGAAPPNPARLATVARAEETSDPPACPVAVTRPADAARFPVGAPRPHLVSRCLEVQARLTGSSVTVKSRNLALQQYPVVAALGPLLLEVLLLLVRVALPLPLVAEVAEAGAVI